MKTSTPDSMPSVPASLEKTEDACGSRKPVEVVCAVVCRQSDNHILCVRKGPTKYAYTSHRWEFPGGKVEPQESPRQALARELREEMDLNVEISHLIAMVCHTYPDFTIKLNAFLCYCADNVTFTLKEHVESCWLAADRLSSLEWCAADTPIARLLTNPSTLDNL